MTGEDLDAVDGAGERCKAPDSGAFCADCSFGGRLSVNSRQSILTRQSILSVNSRSNLDSNLFDI